MKMKTIAAAASLLALPMAGHAGEFAGFTTSGYVDFSYQTNDYHSSGNPAGIGNIGGHDDFSLNQVAVTLAKTPAAGFGAVINAVMGDQASNFGGVQSNNGGGEIALAQGYAQYACASGLTIMGGKFFTLAGSEVFASTGNSQATRGLLFGIQPFTLTGVRASYKIGDMFTLTGGLVNERDGNTKDANDPKAVEFQAALAASGVNVALTHYATSESALAELNSFTDLVVGASFGVVTLGLNVDVVSGDDAADRKQTGVAVYGGVQASEMVKVSLRVESLKDERKVGNATVETKQSEITLTGGFALAKEFDLLAEVRLDKFDDAKPFVGGDGKADDSGTTAVLKGIYKF